MCGGQTVLATTWRGERVTARDVEGQGHAHAGTDAAGRVISTTDGAEAVTRFA